MKDNLSRSLFGFLVVDLFLSGQHELLKLSEYICKKQSSTEYCQGSNPVRQCERISKINDGDQQANEFPQCDDQRDC